MWGPKFLKGKGGKFLYKIKYDNGKPRMVEGNMKFLYNGVCVEKGFNKNMEKPNM